MTPGELLHLVTDAVDAEPLIGEYELEVDRTYYVASDNKMCPETVVHLHMRTWEIDERGVMDLQDRLVAAMTQEGWYLRHPISPWLHYSPGIPSRVPPALYAELDFELNHV